MNRLSRIVPLAVVAACAAQSSHISEAYEVDRTVLPIQAPPVPKYTALDAGSHQVVLDFVYDGGGLGKGGTARLLVDGEVVGEGRVEKTQPLIFSADETADVGLDNQTPVAEGIGVGPIATRFSGTIDKILLEVHPDESAE